MIDESREIDVCPYCESAAIRHRVGGGGNPFGEHQRQGADPEKAYWCKDCRTGFDEAKTRTTTHGGGKSKLEVLIDEGADVQITGADS